MTELPGNSERGSSRGCLRKKMGEKKGEDTIRECTHIFFSLGGKTNNVKNHGAFSTIYVNGIILRLFYWFKCVFQPFQAHESSNGSECEARPCFLCSTRIVSTEKFFSPPILLDNLKRLSTPVFFFWGGVKKQKRDKLACAQHSHGYHKHTAHAFAT